MKPSKHKFFSLLSFVLIFSCGTKVTTGANGTIDPADNVDDGNSDDATGISVEKNDFGVIGDVFPTGVEPERATCFGQSPVMPQYLKEFCESSTAQEHRADFKTFTEKICDDATYINLFRDACTWTGDDKPERFFRVIEHTDLKDSSTQQFYFLAGFSTTVNGPVNRLIDQWYLRFQDSEAFKRNYSSIENSTVLSADINKDEGIINYKAQLVSSSATASYTGRSNIAPISEHLTVVYDQALKDMVLVKEHRYMMFYVPIDADHTRIVGLDEKLIQDSGNHPVAYTNVLTVAKRRMTMEFENAPIE